MAADDDIDDWSASVAGRGAAAGPTDGVPELRSAIRSADAEAARAGAADRVGLERLLQRLEREGLLEREPTVAAAPSRSRRAPVWLAAAASVALAVVGLRLLMPSTGTGPEGERPSLPPAETTRGFAGVVKLAVADPEASAAAIERELAGLGLEPRRSPATGRIIIEVDVSAERLDAFHEWAVPRGGRAVTPGRYRVILEPAS